MTAILVLLNGQMSPKRDYLLQPTEQTIGRGNKNTIPLSTDDGHTVKVTGIDDKEVHVNNILTASKTHGKLLLVNGQWTIQDISDKNFIVINGGNHINKNTPVPIQNGDIISLGHAQLKFLQSVEEAIQQAVGPAVDPTIITH